MKYLTQATNPIGSVQPPGYINTDVQNGVIGNILNLFINLLIVGGGVFALVNFILAGYAFMSAGDDPKKVEGAWGKIYQTLIGLSFMAGSFVLAAIFGQLLYGDASRILSPVLPGL